MADEACCCCAYELAVGGVEVDEDVEAVDEEEGVAEGTANAPEECGLLPSRGFATEHEPGNEEPNPGNMTPAMRPDCRSPLPPLDDGADEPKPGIIDLSSPLELKHGNTTPTPDLLSTGEADPLACPLPLARSSADDPLADAVECRSELADPADCDRKFCCCACCCCCCCCCWPALAASVAPSSGGVGGKLSR